MGVSEKSASSFGLFSSDYDVCGGTGEGGNESGGEPLENPVTVEQALNYEFSEDVSFLPWMKMSFRVFGSPRDISLNVKFGVAPYIRLFFDPLSFEQYGSKEDSALLRSTPDTWNTFTIPLYRMAKELGLFNGFNAPTNISTISVSAYGERKTWESWAIFDNFWVATPVPLVEDYAEKAALSRDNYYKILNVTKESNFELLKQDISEIFAASYMGDFEYLAEVLGIFTQHLFPSGEMAEFTDASVRVISYNNSLNESVPLFVLYSFPGGLENVSFLAAYNYTNIPNLDLSREAVLNANLTQLCQLLARGGGVLTPYGLSDQDLAYLPYGTASFVIINDTVCIDRLSAKPCTIQSVLATIASIAERVWNHKCVAQVVEQEEEAQEIGSLRAFINEEAYRVDTFNKLLAALQWVNYMHPYNWDKKSFDVLLDPVNSPYWLSYTYAAWGNETGYERLSECLANITQMLDFGDYFGAPPVFITSGEYNRTAGAAGEKCVLIYKALERDASWNYLLGAVQGEILCAIFNDTDVLNVAREFGRRVNSTLADVYVYLAEMAFMYTRPYNTEDILGSPVSENIQALFSGSLGGVEQILSNIGEFADNLTMLPFLNLKNTLDIMFMQKLNKQLAILGVGMGLGPTGFKDVIDRLGDEETSKASSVYSSEEDYIIDPELLSVSCPLIPMPSESFLYESSESHWRSVIDNPYTNFLLPDMVEYAKKVNVNLPEGQKKGIISPIINTALQTFGLESGSIGSVMLRLFAAGRWPVGQPLKIFIDQKIADYMNLPKTTDLKVADYWFEKLIDASPWYLDLTTGLLEMLDDYENPAGTVYWGVDVFSSILVPAGSGGAFLKVSVSIKNDPGTCNGRLAYLSMRDGEGKLILSNERLVSMGWGILKNHDLPDGDGVGQLWHNDNVELFIDRNTGRITKYMVQDMTTLKNPDLDEGFANGQRYGADNMDRVIIDIPQEGGEEMVDCDVTNREWMGSAKTGCGMTHMCFVFKNLDRINPVQTISGEDKVSGIHRSLWKSRIAYEKETGGYKNRPMQQEIPDAPEFQYYPILRYLIRDLGLSYAEPIYRMRIENTPASDKSVPQINSILELFDVAARMPLDWAVIKDFVHHNFMELELDVMTSPDRIISERTSYLSLFHEALLDYDGKKVFVSRIMDLLLLSYTHCLFGTSHANTEYFVIPENTIKEQPKDGLGNIIPTSEWDHSKKSLAIFLDQMPYPSQPKVSLIAIPVFKEGAGITQLTPIDKIFERQHKQPSPAIPIENKEELVYGNVEYYLLYHYVPSDVENPYKPYSNIVNPSTNIFAPDDLKLGDMNEIIKFLRIMQRICQLTGSYGRPGQENYDRSTAAFLKQLEGLMMNYQEAGLKIFEALGGFEAMDKMREFYPLHPLTNTQQQGLIMVKDMFSDLFDIINSKTATEQEKQLRKAF